MANRAAAVDEGFLKLLSWIGRSIRHGALRPFRKIGRTVASRWPFPFPVTIFTGRRMYVDLRSGIGQGLLVTGEFDPAVFGPIASRLRPGGTFVDVGANVGYYSMCALDLVGKAGQIHAFEIDPRPLRCLTRSVATFRYANLTVHPVAVGASVGSGKLIKQRDCGHSHVSDAGEGVPIPMTSLDAWRDEFGVTAIQAMKIDVEGGEYAVLKGAETLLREERPVIVFEADDALQAKHGSTCSEIIGFLQQRGYRVERLRDTWSPTVVAYPAE